MSKLLIGAIAALCVVGLAGGAWAWSVRAIETPDYTVQVSDGPFEVRAYPKLVLASIQTTGNRGEAVRRAFSPLASYIFAKERPGEKIAMTAPVTQKPGSENWTVSFIMPAGNNINDLPRPAEDITLEETQPRLMAAVRFSGRWTDARFAEAKNRLETWIASQGLTPNGEVEFAYYNDPFTPPFLRRNEVLMEVSR